MRHKIMPPLLVLTVLVSSASAANTTATQRQPAAQAHQRPGVNGQDHHHRAESGDDRTPGRAAQTDMNRPDARNGRITGQHQQGTRAPNPRGTPAQPARPSGERGSSNSAPAQQGAPLTPLGGALRGATSVTFYNGDPLKGAQATQTLQLSGLSATQATALRDAAQQASFAVIERPGGRIVVDLKVPSTQAVPRTPQRGNAS